MQSPSSIRRKIRLMGCALIVHFLCVAQVMAQTYSCIVTNIESSEPALAFFASRIIYTTNCFGTNLIIFPTAMAPISGPPGYRFTHWTLNGIRAEDLTGRAANPAKFLFTNNIASVAHYVLSNSYTADSLVPDWYKIEFFGTTNVQASSDTDSDGYDLFAEFSRNYHPRLHDDIVEGGIARRRSDAVLAIANTNYVLAGAVSDPPGLYSQAPTPVLKGSYLSFPARPNVGSTHELVGWFLGSNRVDDPHGFSAGTLNLLVTNETLLTGRFLTKTNDIDNDGLEDWFELLHFNQLTITPSSDPDADSFNIATEKTRGYSPNAFDDIVEGGIARRRSSVLDFIPAPPTVAVPPSDQNAAAGTNITLTVTPQGIGPFLYQWRLNGVDIPGATNGILVISNAQPLDSGSFSVAIANAFGVVGSAPALVVVESPLLGFVDNIADRLLVMGNSGLGSGSNSNATREVGEPRHAGKFGSNSVWLAWQPSSNGVVTFSTRGSSFDTVLVVYTNGVSSGGIGLSNLVTVAVDDDRGGYLTSEVTFNANTNQEYLLAVDGFAGRGTGYIVLSWNLVPTLIPFPSIVAQPFSRAAQEGTETTFSVIANSPVPLHYQWSFNGSALPGATNASLTVTNVQESAVGFYAVTVTDEAGQATLSLAAALELGPEANFVSQDKPESFLESAGPIFAASGPLQSASAPTSLPFLSVSVGTIAAQTLDNSDGLTQAGEANHCNLLCHATKWMSLRADVTGRLQIDTIGSRIDTVMAVYLDPYQPPPSLLRLVKPIDCDNNGAPDHTNALVEFSATAGDMYWIAVDGVNNAKGLIRLNWRLAVPPVRMLPPGTNTAVLGDTFTLYATIPNPMPGIRYQWRRNGANLLGATNEALVLNSVTTNTAGLYSVVASNFAGVVTNTVAKLDVAIPVLLSLVPSSGSLSISGIGNTPFVLEASTNLIDWRPVSTSSSAGSQFSFSAPIQTNRSGLFYRAGQRR